MTKDQLKTANRLSIHIKKLEDELKTINSADLEVKNYPKNKVFHYVSLDTGNGRTKVSVPIDVLGKGFLKMFTELIEMNLKHSKEKFEIL